MSHSETGTSLDLRERGLDSEGKPSFLERRLFMQLLVFGASQSSAKAISNELPQTLRESKIGNVLYEDLNNPFGFGLLSWSEDPADFVTKLRPALLGSRFADLEPRHEFTMIGRSYASGYEQDLEYWLLKRPLETVLNPAWPWAVWYPLRRVGAFERLEGREKGAIMREHGQIGKAYGTADLAHDVRLACHGLDAHDNEFLIGLIGKDLHPLSHVVQAMRQTRQTSEFMQQMGPFFVGRAIHRDLGPQTVTP